MKIENFYVATVCLLEYNQGRYGNARCFHIDGQIKLIRLVTTDIFS